jgi:alkanesulfonate monooxygenase SsuD/methylene tetrahydromethanopterin reductase-like flavin-dependent oxidoreductase (luciferase family)
MKFGVVLPLFLEGKAPQPAALLDLAQAAETLGYESIWVQDDPGGKGLDALAMLGMIAGATKRVRLGFSILVLPQREAVATARALATMDLLAGGRVVAGVGVGSARHRSPVYDAETADRGRLMDEQIEVMRRAWRGEPGGFDGRWVKLERAASPPPPRGDIPVYIGTWGNEGGLRRVVRSGQGWLASGIATRQERFVQAARRLDEMCAEAGRDPESVERGYVNCPLALADSYEAGVAMAAPLLRGGYGREPHEAGVPFVGTPNDARRTLDAIRMLPLDLVCVFPQRIDPDMLELFRDEVAGGF